MADLDTFLAEVKAKIKQLSAPDASTRRQAAEWLGEAGEPMAITALVQAYKNDSDADVRAAAEYSLGMFRKLETEMHGPNAQKVGKLIEDIVFKGKMGRRARFAPRMVGKLALGLILSGALTGLMGLILPPILRGAQPAAPAPIVEQVQPAPSVPEQSQPVQAATRDRATLVAEMRAAYSALLNNANTLQTQYQGVLGGGQLDCAAFFASVSPFALSADESTANADLADLAGQFNSAVVSFITAKGAAFDRVCQQNQTVAAGEYGAPLRDALAVVTSLSAVDSVLTQAGG